MYIININRFYQNLKQYQTDRQLRLIRQFRLLNSSSPLFPSDRCCLERKTVREISVERFENERSLGWFRGEPLSLSRLSRCTTICRGSCTTHHCKLRAPDPDLDSC